MHSNNINMEAWNNGAYKAWVGRFGPPELAAEKLKQNTDKKIGEIFPYFHKDLQGKKIMNMLGSNAMKAVALSILGANVTVVDYSSENEKYAKELAIAAGVNLHYIISDVLMMPPEELTGDYDIVFMENGILHYFLNLDPLFQVVRALLHKGGRMILQDFHPVSTKLISSRGTTANIRKHKVTGDYFDTSVVERDISFSKYADDNSSTKVLLRNWTIGEVVTAVASAGLFINILKELPNTSSEVFDHGIPKSFIITAEKL